MKENLAKLTTAVLNPFLTGFVVIALLSFEGSDGTAEAVKWASLATVLSVLPVLAAVLYLVRRKKMDGVFESTRRQRVGVYLAATALGAVGYGLLAFLEAPQLLVATFATGLASIVVFSGINLVWKISLHTAFMAGAAAILVMVYGATAAWVVILLPPLAWARMTLGQHTLAQVIAGALVAAVIVVLIFWSYGLLGQPA
jgi:membrane-associated phospholipid phosphatase